MAAVSPTPLGSGYNSNSGSGYDANRSRRPLSQQYPIRQQSSRPNLKRGSPLANIAATYTSQQRDSGDSSDDESGMAPALSVEAQALLGVRTSSGSGAVGERDKNYAPTAVPVKSVLNYGQFAQGSPRYTASTHTTRERQRAATPPVLGATYHSPRIVRLPSGGSEHGSGNGSGLRRAKSVSAIHNGSPSPVVRGGMMDDMITPAPRIRRVGMGSAASEGGSGAGSAEVGSQGHLRSALEAVGESDGLRYSHNSSGRSRPLSEAVMNGGNVTIGRTKMEDATHGSVRIKRVGKVTGTLLRGPARRGVIRRQSEDDSPGRRREPLQEADELQVVRDENDAPVRGSVSPKVQEFGHVRFASKAEVNVLPDEPSRPASTETSSPKSRTTPASGLSLPTSTSSSKKLERIFKVPPLPSLPSRHDQENEPPPTFKRNVSSGLDLLESKPKMEVLNDRKPVQETPGTGSPVRKPLGVRSQNTPHRPAPPPPRMNVLDTLTAPAGAASAQQKKKKSYLQINGRLFTRMDCIGRGGSGRVYRVMAENHKILALKRVSLEDVDETAIRGFKGEIMLLQKLKDVDRVVQLYDYEINEEKKMLSVLMELGEIDLNNVLAPYLNEQTGRFDITMARHIWKEMLECVQAVHAHDVVHSDLKPANFVLVQGKLKLIDFGIANAIQEDTVNVHRETQIGTPNYMPPEALLDHNAAKGLTASLGKMMKLGKPSDVWSLGCILYQMVYRRPPFGHIPNAISKVMAITNKSHVIEFPSIGHGRVPVPAGLLRTLKGCLKRDPAQRPTIERLLAEDDPFLYPDAGGKVSIDERLLGMVQGSLVRYIKANGVPGDEEMADIVRQLWGRLRAAVEEGKA
jgi:serine/threonine-protein kinase TTK/MPS1